MRSSGRGRLPVCVVRMRSVLAFMAPYDSTWVSLDAMATIKEIQADHYRIPLPVALSDSTHGTIRDFELITVRARDADGAEGVGYTYTVGAGGAAVHALLARDLAPLLIGRDAERIEALWQTMWWALHYGGRGGAQALAISAVDIALWDLRARRHGAPLWRLLGGFDPRVPCYAGGIDLDFPLDALLRQTDDNLARGFRAIKMKVGRPSLHDDVERVRAMRAHLGRDFPLMADANMRWSVDDAIRAARALADQQLVWLEEPTIPDDVPGHARIVREGGVPIAAGENLHTLYEFRALIAAGGVTLSGARRHQLRRRERLHEGLPPGRVVQPAGDLARRPRPQRAPAGGGAESLVPRSARLRPRPLHRRAAADRGRLRDRAGAAGPRRGVRLEEAGERPREVARPAPTALSTTRPAARRAPSG